jgi:hypothetical protein
MLVIGHQQDANDTATLSTVCSATPTLAGRSGLLRLAAGDDAKPDLNHASLIVIVAVVDGLTPDVSETTRGATTVLAVSAGAATADQLARVAVSAADDRRDIAGIIVADPDPADHTTGRLPQPTRPAGHRRPTRLANAAGTTTAGNGR